MNDRIPADLPELSELSDRSVERIERDVFATIAQDRAAVPAAAGAATRRRRRRRGWLTGLGVAAAFVAGVLITPPLLNVVSTTTAGGPSDVTAATSDGSAGGSADTAAPESSSQDVAGAAEADTAGREIIASARATVRVDDVAAGAEAVAALADQHGGYVESTDISAAASTTDTSMPAPPDGEYGWISIRVPAADLTTVIGELEDAGTVLSSSTSKQDVTSTAIDLRARVDAARASVERLTELMSQSGSVSELIDAEVALTDRQAQLESYTQQLAALEDQVAMSSLQVELTRNTTVAPAEPAGFGDGLLAGWNGLIVSLNALVIAVGFLLPWLAVAGVVAMIVWLVVRHRHRSAQASESR